MLPVLVLGVLCTEKGYLDNILLLVAHKVVAQHLGDMFEQRVVEGSVQLVHRVKVGYIHKVAVHSF